MCQHFISKRDKKAFPSCCKVAVRITIWSTKHSKFKAMRCMQTYWRQQTERFWQWFQFDSYLHSGREQRIKLRTSSSTQVNWNSNTQNTHHWGWVWFAKMTANSKKKDASLEIQVYQCLVRCGYAACDCSQQQLHSMGHSLPWRNCLIFFWGGGE